MMTQIVVDDGRSDRSGRIDRSLSDLLTGNRLIPEPGGVRGNPREEL